MKKVLKSRIFIVIITAILFTGIGIYAANTYQASDVSYTPSDGSEDIKDVNAALNDLYESRKKCTADSFCSKVKLGDYVSMTPTKTSYTISTSLTGYSSSQKITPSELTLWRVIDIRDNGTIEVISENVSSVEVYFTGKTGYLKLVGTLNTIASQYVNSSYTIGSRIVGYTGQTETITDTSKFTTTAPWTSNTSDNSNEALGGGDIMYVSDINSIKKILGTLKATNPSGAATSYWLGSRYYDYLFSNIYSLVGRSVNTSGYISRTPLYGYSGGDYYSNTYSKAIRPILTLKSGLTATGSGTSTDPWVLQ